MEARNFSIMLITLTLTIIGVVSMIFFLIRISFKRNKDIARPFVISLICLFALFFMRVMVEYPNKNYDQLNLEIEFIKLIIQVLIVIFTVSKISFKVEIFKKDKNVESK